MFKKIINKERNIKKLDPYVGPWVTDIKGVKIGQFGSGFYDFADIPIGDHIITVEACNGYHISLDLPDWFDPHTDNWPSITVNKKYKVIKAIEYLINNINRKEGTNYKLEFKNEKRDKEIPGRNT